MQNRVQNRVHSQMQIPHPQMRVRDDSGQRLDSAASYCTARVNGSGRLTGVVAPAGVNAALTVSVYVPVGVPACGVTCAPEPPPPHDVSATAASRTKMKTDATAIRLQTRRRPNPAAHSTAITKTAIAKLSVRASDCSGGQVSRSAGAGPGLPDRDPETDACVGTLTLKGVAPVAATASGDGDALHEASAGAPMHEIETLPENPLSELTCKL